MLHRRDKVAYKAIREERKHPSSQVRMVKDDIQKAFNLVVTVLSMMGLFAVDMHW